MAYKPDGYTSADPYLMAGDAERALALITEGFNAQRLRVFLRGGGGVLHAEARIDDTVIMMGERPDGPDSIGASLRA